MLTLPHPKSNRTKKKNKHHDTYKSKRIICSAPRHDKIDDTLEALQIIHAQISKESFEEIYQENLLYILDNITVFQNLELQQLFDFSSGDEAKMREECRQRSKSFRSFHEIHTKNNYQSTDIISPGLIDGVSQYDSEINVICLPLTCTIK